MNDRHVAQWIETEGRRETPEQWWRDQATLNRYGIGDDGIRPEELKYPYRPHMRPCSCHMHRDGLDRHLSVMPAAQLRRDNQDYYDRIDPDRRRFRYDDG